MTFTEWWESYKKLPATEGSPSRKNRPPFHNEEDMKRVALAAWQEAQWQYHAETL